jgi:hypothetical protein
MDFWAYAFILVWQNMQFFYKPVWIKLYFLGKNVFIFYLEWVGFSGLLVRWGYDTACDKSVITAGGPTTKPSQAVLHCILLRYEKEEKQKNIFRIWQLFKKQKK